MGQTSLNLAIIVLLIGVLTTSIYDRFDKRYINPGSYIIVDQNGNKRYFINPKDHTISDMYYEVDRLTYSEWIKGNDILIRK